MILQLQDQIIELQKRLEALEKQVNPDIHFFSKLPGFELKYSKDGDAGFNLPIWDERLINGELSEDGTYILQPQEAFTFKTGIHIGLPYGYYALADTRSGTSKVKLDLLCRTIDGCYRGELRASLINLNTEPVVIKNEAQVFQIVILKHAIAKPVKHSSYEEFISAAGETERGANGYNSTGGNIL